MEGEQHKGSTAATGQAAPLPYPACLACPPAAGPVAPRMRTSGEADIAHAQTRLTRHGAYELTRPDHEENACHQVQKKKFQQHLPALLFFSAPQNPELSWAQSSRIPISCRSPLHKIPQNSQKLKPHYAMFSNIPEHSSMFRKSRIPHHLIIAAST